MNDETLLSRLRDIRLPEPPPADPAWDIWLSLLITVAALVIFWLARKRPGKTWQHEAVAALEQIDPGDPERALVDIASVVRRVARVLDGTASDDASDKATLPVDHQTGDQYLASLDRLLNTRFFSNGLGRVLGDDLYRQQAEAVDTGTLAQSIGELILSYTPATTGRAPSVSSRRGANTC